jgi:hypothetical protein
LIESGLEAMSHEYMSCRRTKYVQAAYVEAAVHINRVYGSDRAYWMLIREKVPQAVIERVLRGDPECVRRKDRRYATRRETIREPAPANATSDLRKDHLTSQRVDVALVFETMLGPEYAKEYLQSVGVPIRVAERVLSSDRRRPSPELVTE